jgi:glycerol uptake facilitator-like aquaporin
MRDFFAGLLIYMIIFLIANVSPAHSEPAHTLPQPDIIHTLPQPDIIHTLPQPAVEKMAVSYRYIPDKAAYEDNIIIGVVIGVAFAFMCALTGVFLRHITASHSKFDRSGRY